MIDIQTGYMLNGKKVYLDFPLKISHTILQSIMRDKEFNVKESR